MRLEEIQVQYQQVTGLLKEHRLKEAMQLMQMMTQACGNYQLQQELEGVQTAYGYMLQYMQQGMNDPERETLYHSLLTQAYHLADLLHLSLLENQSSKYYFTLRKQLKDHPFSLSKILANLESFPDSLSLFELLQDEEKLQQDLKVHEEALGQLFKQTWVNSRWSTSERDAAYKFLSSELITANDLSLFVSAVTMSLMTCFDEGKMLWLIEAFYHKDNNVKVRAWVGFLLVTHLQSERIALYPGIQARLSLIQEEQPSFDSNLNAVYIQLLRSQDTERINKTMNEEIVPEVMKNIQNRKQKPLEESDVEMNPEWIFDLDPKLNNKMRKLGELQQEGGDINMGMFSMMKRFPFFEHIQNWFYPYEPNHTEVKKAMSDTPEKEKKVGLLLMQLGMLCDSDCYSTVFMMKQMSEEQRQMVFHHLLPEELRELTEEAASERYADYAQSPALICKYYIQDLYRFFKLYPLKAEFHDIFKDDLMLHENPILKPLLYQAAYIRQVADFLFKTEKFELALNIYLDLERFKAADKDVLQRIGYCYERVNKDYASASYYYNLANDIAPESTWTLRRLATCYRHRGLFEKAKNCYQELMVIEPENLSYSYFLGTCLIELGEFDEALQCFYKMDLEEEDNIKAWRGIVWCCFRSGKLDKAQQYNEKIIALQPDANDWLNAGHVAWCKGNLSQAVAYYRQGSQAASSPFAFRKLFQQDYQLLRQKGISKTDFILMLDLI